MFLPIRVLIIEDSEDDCLLLLRELRRGGFEPTHLRIETAPAMETALELNEWDIILSDYSMPNFTAPAALKQLKKTQKDIPFIVVSGNVGEVVAVQLMQYGAVDYVNKDNLSRLCPAMQRELNEHRLRKEQKESAKITDRLWDIFNHSLNEIYVFNSTTYTFTVVNQAALRNLNYSMNEMSNKHPWDLKPDINKDQFIDHMEPLVTGEKKSIHFEATHLRKNGTTYPVEVRVQLSKTGDESNFFAIILDISERKKAIENIKSVAKFPEENPEPVLRINYNGDILYNNPSSNYLLDNWNATKTKKAPKSWFNIINICQETREYQYYEEEINQKIFSWLLYPSKLEDYINCYGRNITEQKKTEKVLKQSAQVFNNISEGIMICNEHDEIIALNPAFTDITQYKIDDLNGKSPSILETAESNYSISQIKSAVISDGNWSGEFSFKKKNGETVPVHLSLSSVKHEEMVSNLIFVVSDLGERKKAQEHIHNLSYFDPLTNLPNRLHVHERLFDIIDEAQTANQIVSIIYLDLNRFKTINESLGHKTADKALSLVAKRLSDIVPNEAFLGRMGGDEFIIINQDNIVKNEDNYVVSAITQMFKESFELQGEETFISATIGVSHFPENGKTVDTLIKHAESAVAFAKREERSFVIYSDELLTTNKDHIKFETSLRKALERNEYVLYYQPKIDLKTKNIVGLEALIRWIHPETGLVPPGNFIPLLEETGLIVPVGEWVIKESCRQINQWEKENIEPVNISVNLSGKQFNQENMVSSVTNILRAAEVSPKMIELEVTESTIMRQYDKVIGILNELHDQEFQISIDDFGTGYSSLAYLKHFPIDVLKIDRSFVMEIPDDKDDTAIVNTIISMGHNLNLKVIAEGVETEEQVNTLSQLGCELAQGFYFSKPLPANEISKMLKNKIC